MPEYLAPGVYLEEVSFRAKTIEGVSTSTAGFVGPTRYGPTAGEPELLTSFADFERIYGGLDELNFGDSRANSRAQPNFLAHAVRAFFEEGGKRLYVARIASSGLQSSADNQGIESPPPALFTLQARFPGRAGDFRITFTPQLSENLLIADPATSAPRVRRIRERDTVVLTDGSTSPLTSELYDVVRAGDLLTLERAGTTRQIADLIPEQDQVRLLTVDVSIERPIVRPKRPELRFDPPEVLTEFGWQPQHARSLTGYFAQNPQSRRFAISVPFAIEPPGEADTGYEIAEALLGADVVAAAIAGSSLEERQRVYLLTGGHDGERPGNGDYEGDGSASQKSGLSAFEDLEDISIVAAPGYSFEYGSNPQRGDAIQAVLINHCLKMRYRVAVLDAANGHTLSEVRQYRGKIDSTHAALYYPWVTILDPLSGEELNLPPSGFVAGIYARNDIEKGVHKAPANEVVRLAIGFEFLLNKAQQDVLNPEGINAFRFFEGRGYRLWGARTISSDSEWTYVNVRRYFAFLERSIERGTQYVVFENNNETLWPKVRRTIEDFLFNEWKSGHLLGEKPQDAFFVRCDRSTMTQADLDLGRLICLIGVAPVRPAEFVIFRIGQFTADSQR